MAEPESPQPLRDLDARLKRLRTEDEGGARAAAERGRGLSLALRIGTELVAALVVGVGIGLLLDGWLGTAPWLLVLFFVLGAAAGMLNVYRVMARINQTPGSATGKESEAERRGKR